VLLGISATTMVPADACRHRYSAAGTSPAAFILENFMQRLAFALGALLIAAPAFAGPDCSGREARMPMWQIAKAFEDAGGQIREMRVSDGCYEIYGTKDAQRLEIYYDPTTGDELEREVG